jgi:hypothetical protein
MPALTELHALIQRSISEHALAPRRKTSSSSSSSKKKRPGVVYVGGTQLETWKIVLIVMGSVLAALLIGAAIYWYAMISTVSLQSEKVAGSGIKG